MPWQISSSPRGGPSGSHPCQYSPTPSTPLRRPSTCFTPSACSVDRDEVQIELQVVTLGQGHLPDGAAPAVGRGEGVEALRQIGEAEGSVRTGPGPVDVLALLPGDDRGALDGSVTAPDRAGDRGRT